MRAAPRHSWATLAGKVSNGGRACVRTGVTAEISVPSPQFHCEPKSTFKKLFINIHIFIENMVYGKKRDNRRESEQGSEARA